MKVLITGVNGFLGRNISKNLIDNGHDVFGVSMHCNNLTDIVNKIHFVQCDMNSIDTIIPGIIDFHPDTIIHCAWWGGNNYIDTNSFFQYDNNIPALAKLMLIASHLEIKHFIGLGSAAEYGNKNIQIYENFQEDPITLYGTTKTMAKLYTKQICNQDKIKWTWVRPFYTYGPYDVKTRLIPKTILSCLKNENMVLSECKSLADYLYIDDFVNIIHDIVINKHEGIYNICSGDAVQIRSIVEHIKWLTKSSSKIIFDEKLNRSNYPSVIWGNNYKLQKVYGQVNKTDILTGLEKTIEFYKNENTNNRR